MFEFKQYFLYSNIHFYFGRGIHLNGIIDWSRNIVQISLDLFSYKKKREKKEKRKI